VEVYLFEKLNRGGLMSNLNCFSVVGSNGSREFA